MTITKIKIIRLQRGLRQWDIAKEIGVSESYLSKIENGKVKPNELLMKSIAKLLKVPVEEIINKDEGRVQTISFTLFQKYSRNPIFAQEHNSHND